MMSDNAHVQKASANPASTNKLAETLSFPLTMSMFASKADLTARLHAEREAAATALSKVESVLPELREQLALIGCDPAGFAISESLEPLLKRLEDAMVTPVPDPLPEEDC